jgi:streptogramin lyase
MSNALNLSLLASRNNLGNAGDAFISQGNDIAPSLGPLSAGVLSLSGINQLTGQIGVNKSTGVVTISAQPHLCELDVPGWDKGQHITQWSTLQKYLSATALTNSTIPASSNYVEIFGSFPGGASFVGGVVALNGYVYLVPAFVSKYYKINPIDNSVTSFGTTPWNGNQLGAFNGGVLAPNGKIYFIPAGTSMCYGVDPSSDTIFSFGTFTGNTIVNNTSLYAEGVLAPNGKIYCFPYRSSLCQIIDPSNNSVASFGTFVQSGNGIGGVLAPNGKIYMAIDSSNVAKIIDPSNNTVTAFATLSFNPGSANGAIASNGKIYMADSTSYGIVIDPSNNNITSFGTFAFAPGTEGQKAVVLPNGYLYFFAHKGTLAHIVDPSNNTVTSFSIPHGGTGVASYHGGVQALNGKLFYVPHAATNSVAVNFSNNNLFNSNYITNPMAKP